MSGPRAPHSLRHKPQSTPLKFEESVMAAFQPYREVRDRWRQLPRISAGAPPPWPLDRNTAWASVEMAMSSTRWVRMQERMTHAARRTDCP